MSKYILKIELLSDMCVSDGGVYNSALDIDVCHDKYGFPYIPAKRLKGCLRESALELNDWGEKIEIEKIFGGKEDKKAALRIENAYLKNYGELKDYVIKNKNSKILHPQNVLNNYSYIRTQTSINYETGVADDGSLRTMRVVKKGLVFNANVILADDYKDTFEKCCKNLIHIGVSRTRGLGEVKLALEKVKEENSEAKVENKVSIDSGVNCFEYALTLMEPIICKSINGGEANTLDYIEGSKILGLIAHKLKENKKDFLEFMSKGELFCSNAYIAHEGKRCTEVPAYIYSIKNDSKQYVDKLRHEEPEGKQLNAMKHCYISYNDNGEMIKKSVDTEEHYHHSRPEDKSIGRADDNNGESKFYQMASICEGQVFRGYVSGTNEQIKELAELINEGDIAYIGYSKSAEYGKTVITECKYSKKNEIILSDCKEIAVKLESPAIIYNANATYSTNPEDLIEEINLWLGIDKKVKECTKYMKYTTVGGFNVTWGMRKPTIEAFDKGTVLHYIFNESLNIKVPAEFYVGERISEGYGECSVSKIEKSENGSADKVLGRLCTEEEKNVDGTVNFQDSKELAKNICNRLFKEFVKSKAIECAGETVVTQAERATVSNMLLMCREMDSFENIKTAIGERYDKSLDSKQNKRCYASEIVKKAEEIIDGKKDNSSDTETEESMKEKFKNSFSVDNYEFDEEKIKKYCLEEYLVALKYKIRSTEIGKGGKN